MSYDLNVLIINQEKPTKLTFESLIEIRNEIDFTDSGRYHSIWGFMTRTKGIWYSLGKEEEGWFNSLSLVDADFDMCVENLYIPYWVIDSDSISNLKPLIVYENYKSDFEKLIDFLIQQSPDRTIMFLSRYQGGEHEIVCGVLKYSEFIRLLNERKILFNVCYIISE